MEAEFEQEYETSEFGYNNVYKADREDYGICGVDEDDRSGCCLETDQVQARAVM
jgi:hypothetical protein